MVPLVQQMQNCIDRQQSCYRQKKKQLGKLGGKKTWWPKKTWWSSGFVKEWSFEYNPAP